MKQVIRSSQSQFSKPRTSCSLIWKKSLSCFNLTNYQNISEKCPFNQHSKCFFFSIVNSELNFVKILILDSGELAGACAMHELQNLGKGFFIKAFCPGRSYTKFRATTGSSSNIYMISCLSNILMTRNFAKWEPYT